LSVFYLITQSQCSKLLFARICRV